MGDAECGKDTMSISLEGGFQKAFDKQNINMESGEIFF